MYSNFLIHFVLLCGANPSDFFANKIVFFSQRKQLKPFDLRVAMRFMKFYYFSTRHVVGIENNVNRS